jgi:hypothetical protein
MLACPAVNVAAKIAGMKPIPGHRKQIRHYHDPGHIHELTFSCFHRLPLLTNDVWRGMLAESADRAMEGHCCLYHNPVRWELVERAVDWKWSSARYYLHDPPQQCAGLPTVYSLPAEWINDPR